jgi:3-methyladenine DNA glycosylase Mpg
MKSAPRSSRSRVKRLTQTFFRRPAEDVARALIGKILLVWNFTDSIQSRRAR